MKGYFWILWKSTLRPTKHRIGKLSREGEQFCFEYNLEGLEAAAMDGFIPYPCFPKVTKKYYSDTIFPAFELRIPPKEKRNIQEILDEFGLKEYDQIELLKATGGKLHTDNYEFEYVEE